MLVVSIIAGFGTAQIAANAVANNLDNLGLLPGHAINLAVITVIGRCMGAGDSAQAKYYLKKMLKITYMMLACLNIVLLASLPWILNVYSYRRKRTAVPLSLVWIP